MVISLILAAISVLPAGVGAVTGVPKILNHQGRLLDSNGNLLGGAGTDFCFRFAIWDVSTGGTRNPNQLWPTGYAVPSTMTINVKNGIFNVGIGSGADTLDFNFQDNNTVYLDVEVATKVGADCAGGDEVFEDLSPRQRIVSSGYTINSDTVDGFHAAQSATGSQIPVLSSGNLGLGTTNPQINVTGSNTLTFQGGGQTGDIQFFGTSNKITSAGALTIAGGFTAVGVNSGAGLLQGALGLTITGAAISLNASSNFDINLATGTSTGDIILGGGTTGQLISINSDDWDISTTGAITGVSFDVNGTGNSLANVEPGDLNATGAGDELCLTYELTGVVFEWQTCGGGGGTLQSAYDTASGNTILTTTARNIAFTLGDVVTPTSFTLENQDTAGVSAQRIFNSIATGTLTNGLLVEQTGAGTMTNAIQVLGTAGAITSGILIADGAGTIATGLSMTGTFTNLIDTPTFDVSNAGTVTIAASQSYAGAGAVTLSSGGGLGLTLDSASNALTIDSTDTTLTASGLTTLTLGAGVSLTNASGIITFQPAGAATISRVQIGAGGIGTTSPDFLALDVKSDTGDPAGGAEGYMYYNTLDNKFRCYQNNAWTDCIGTGGSGVAKESHVIFFAVPTALAF